jgi:hypothetical protein
MPNASSIECGEWTVTANGAPRYLWYLLPIIPPG